MGYSGQIWLLVASLAASFYCSATNNYGGMRAASAATGVVVLVWWLEAFAVMYTALSNAETGFDIVALACDPSVDKNTAFCRTSKGAAVLNIFIGIALVVQMYAGFKRSKEIEADGAERSSASGYKFIALGMRLITYFSVLGLAVMVAAHMHITGKGTYGALVTPAVSGIDDSALLLLIISTFVVFYVRDSATETIQANLRYSTLAAALTAACFWSTFLFKVRNWTNNFDLAAGDPCNVNGMSSSSEDCRSQKAYGAGWILVMASQSLLVAVSFLGSCKAPGQALEI